MRVCAKRMKMCEVRSERAVRRKMCVRLVSVCTTPAREKAHLAIVHVCRLGINLSMSEARTLRVPEETTYTGRSHD